MIQHYKNGVKFIWIGFILNLLETWYFGWNTKPINDYEMIADYFCAGIELAGLSLVGYAFILRRK